MKLLFFFNKIRMFKSVLRNSYLQCQKTCSEILGRWYASRAYLSSCAHDQSKLGKNTYLQVPNKQKQQQYQVPFLLPNIIVSILPYSMALFRSISVTTPPPSSSEPLFYHMGGKNTPDKSRMVTLRLIPNAASSGSSMSSGSGVEYTGNHTTSSFSLFFFFIFLYIIC